MKQRSCSPLLWPVLAGLLLLVTLPAQASSDSWKLDDIHTLGLGGNVQRFVYVPKGTVWQGVTLELTAQPVTRGYLEISLDDKRVLARQVQPGESLSVPLGTLNSGFHNLQFQLAQRSLFSHGEDAQANYCAETTSGSYDITGTEVLYQAQRQAPKLSALPDILFNPQQPARHAWQIAVVADSSDSLSTSVAARLASGWHAAAGIQWLEAALLPVQQADAVLEITHDPTLDTPARLQILPPRRGTPPTADNAEGGTADDAAPTQPATLPPRLHISFRDEAGAWSAVNALLNTTYLSQLDSNRADLPHAVNAPQWGQERSFTTLADFGVGNVQLGAAHAQSLFLNLPPSWLMTAPAHGRLVYRVQQGLLRGSVLRLRVNHVLAGSQRLDDAHLGNNIDQQLPFTGTDTLTDSNLLPLYVEASMLVTEQCLPGMEGSLWIDAGHSEIKIPHRYKTGVGALQVALLARPHILIGKAPGALSAALALATSMQALVGDDPLPFRVEQIDKATPNPAVRLLVDAGQYQQKIAAAASHINAQYARGGSWIEQQDKEFMVISGDSAGMRNFARHWPDSRNRIPDASEQVFISAQGAVYTPHRNAIAAQLALNANDGYQWLLYLGLVVLVVLMVLAWRMTRQT